MPSGRDTFFLFSVCVSLFAITTQLPSCEETTPSYTYGSASITCRSLNGAFPPFAKTVSTMQCLDCNIPILSEQTTLVNFRGNAFNLSNSHVSRIETGAFTSFGNNTHKLLFENNEITSISKRVFSGFYQMDEIVLRKNNLTNLEAGTFEGTNVSLLDLSQNRIRNISGVFDDLKVTKLNLSSNEITDFPQNVFDQTTFWIGRQWHTSFQSLDLSNNFIFKIVPGTFKTPSSDNFFHSLFLQNNKIRAIENSTFAQMNNLRLLTLDDNYISELNMDSFKGLTSLITLKLRNNFIEKLPPSIFSDLQNLQELDLSLNAITTLTPTTFSGLIGLTKLNISHNNLKVLEDAHLFPLGRLATLDVSDTRLQDLDLPSILEHHYKLRILVINDNFWTCQHLVHMYRQVNERLGGFNYPAHHFDVPNLHGIACSRNQLDVADDMTFDDFMGVIAQDRVFEDLFDSRLGNDFGDMSIADISTAFMSINGIYYMMLIVTVIVVLLFLLITGRCVLQYLYSHNIINDKFRFAYNSNHDHVELI